jgi:hypothetical protein
MDFKALAETQKRELLDSLLDRLEKKEYTALAWGFTEGAFTEAELESEAQAVGGGILTSPSELWKALRNQRLLIELTDQKTPDDKSLYRSRFAETIRLLFRLRQLFPARRPGELVDWMSAKTLVADYRLVRKPRRYPERNLEASDVAHELSSIALSWRQEDAVGRFTENMKLARFQCEAARQILAD